MRSLPSPNHDTPPCGTVTHYTWAAPWTHTGASKRSRHRSHRGRLTILATRSLRWRPYLATTGRRTSVTGLVGLAFSPTERLMGTRSSLGAGGRAQVNFSLDRKCDSQRKLTDPSKIFRPKQGPLLQSQIS